MRMEGIQECRRDETELRRISVSLVARPQGFGRTLLEAIDKSYLFEGYRRILLSVVILLQPAVVMYTN